MFVASLIGMGEWSSKKCALTWKVVGTKYNRYYCQLVPSVLPIEEIESGLLPTPKAIDGTNEGRKLTNGKSISFKTGVRYGISLPQMANNQMLPTPMAQSRQTTKEQTEQRQIKYGDKTRAMYLENFAAMGWLPTPTVSDSNGAYRPESMTDKSGKFDRTQRLVNIYIHTNQEYNSKTSQLNPLFVAEMMGFPTNWTELPFLNGEMNQSKDMEMP
jgi:hypothetical protein